MDVSGSGKYMYIYIYTVYASSWSTQSSQDVFFVGLYPHVHVQDGPLLVINGVRTCINGLING